jgi:hypothetical protein
MDALLQAYRLPSRTLHTNHDDKDDVTSLNVTVPCSIPRGGSDSFEEVVTTTESSISSCGGGEDTISSISFASDLDRVKSNVWQSIVALRLAALQRKIDSGVVMENFGAMADQLPPTATMLDALLPHLEASVNAPLHVLYIKLLSQFCTAALQQY